MRRTLNRASLVLIAVMWCGGVAGLRAEDWPDFRGKGRLGIWKETGIVDRFPAEGLRVRWRTPINIGMSGPTVANGRVYVTDFVPAQPGARQGIDAASPDSSPSRLGTLHGGALRGIERAICLDEKTGRVLWSHTLGEVNYARMFRSYGPTASPTIDGGRVYVVGATGLLAALDAQTGDVLWTKNYVTDYGAEVPPYGYASSPLVDGQRLIALVGGQGSNALVVAFDKMTGKEIWRALRSGANAPGYGQPIILHAGGKRQLIVWHPEAVSSLDPVTGNVYWEHPLKVDIGMTVPTPVHSGSYLFVTSFYNGPFMISLDTNAPRSSVLWKGKSQSEIMTDGLHSTMTTPVLDGDYIYGVDSFGQLRCLEAKTGQRVWETQAVTKERVRWAAAFIVRQGKRFFINNDRGELIIAELSPEEYKEVSRTELIKPTSVSNNRRERAFVNWVHPAYANKSIYIRNDNEILAASLAAHGPNEQTQP